MLWTAGNSLGIDRKRRSSISDEVCFCVGNLLLVDAAVVVLSELHVALSAAIRLL